MNNLHAQSSGEAITDTLKNDVLLNFGDYTVQEALMRIPGIQVNREGEINFRGTGYNSYYVTINGQRISVSGRNSEVADLSTIPLEALTEIQYQKTITPDMDADGLAGVINLKTFKPLTDRVMVSGRIGGGVNPEYVNSTGAMGRSWLRFSAPLSDEVSLGAGISYQRDQNARETLNMVYETADFGEGNVNVMEEFSPGFQYQNSNRIAGNLDINFTPSEFSNYYFRGFINQSNQDWAIHNTTWKANSSWVDESTTGLGGNYNYELDFEEREVIQITIHAGGMNEFDAVNLNYQAGWTQGNVHSSQNIFPFSETGVEYTLDSDNPKRPVATAVEGKPDPSTLDLQEMTYILDSYRDQELTARFNLEFPFEIGALKIGANTRIKELDVKDRGAFSLYHYRYLGFLDLREFETGDVKNRSVFNSKYDLDRLADPEAALRFFDSGIPNMRLDNPAYQRDSGINNYLANDRIFGGYGMFTLALEPFELMAGARVEHSDVDLEGRRVIFNRFNQFEESSDTASVSSNTEFLPNAQLTYNLTDKTTIHFFYSKTLSRPGYNLKVPYELQVPQDTTLFIGNKNLTPVASNNFDLRFNYKLTHSGFVTLNGFYKNISNIIEPDHSVIQIAMGEFPEFDNLFPQGESEMDIYQNSYENSERDASVYGLEVALQYQFSFLPGLLQHMGTYFNYTWSDSNYETLSGEKTTIPGQSPHVVNAALNYIQDRFFAQISYHRSAPSLSSTSSGGLLAQSNSNDLDYLDNYQDGYEALSSSIRFQINKQLQIWADINNILKTESERYVGERSEFPISIYKKYGTEFNLGVRLKL